MNRQSLSLVHYPVVNQRGEVYTTAITNMDVHDIARSATTYGYNQYYLVTPITAQQDLAKTIKEFWLLGSGAQKNPDRKRAMEVVDVHADLEECIARERELSSCEPTIIATSAKEFGKKAISYSACRKVLKEHQNVMLLFGTGHGLAPAVLERSDYVLEPIRGVGPYNHLSVRSAVAIVLDRLSCKD